MKNILLEIEGILGLDNKSNDVLNVIFTEMPDDDSPASGSRDKVK